MTGGSRIIDFRREKAGASGHETEAEAAANEDAPTAQSEAEPEYNAYSDNYAEAYDAQAAPAVRDRVIATVAGLAAIGWTGFMGWHAWHVLEGAAPSAEQAISLLTTWSTPLALIGVGYLLVMRTSAREARRFASTSAALRKEALWLDSVIRGVSRQIDENRAALSQQTHQLLDIGQEASLRMKTVGDAMQSEIESIGRQAHALKNAATAARADMTVLLADLPKAQVQTRRMTEDLREAGLTAHENAGALEARLASLTTVGREADEVASGAAQRLAAHLARMETTSEIAGARLEEAAGQMTTAVDAALTRAADAVDEARKGMEAQSAAMLAMVEQSHAALAQTGAEASAALAARIDDINDRIERLGHLLTAHEASSREIVSQLQASFAEAEQRLAALDEAGSAHAARLSDALSTLDGHASQMNETLKTGGSVAETLIQKSEALLTALDANARELDESLPAAFERLNSRVEDSRARLGAMLPDAEKLEMTALSAHNRLSEAEALLARHHSAIDAIIVDMDRRIAENRAAVDALGEAIGNAGNAAGQFAKGVGPELIDALVRIRETAVQASERAKDSLAEIVPQTSAALTRATDEALRSTITARVEAQMGEIAAAAERAVEAAQAASERLMSQMLTIADATAAVETRIQEGREELQNADREGFSRRVALLIESLNSTAIDVAKILSNDVTDTAWAAYLKGDRGVFTRRAVRLLDAGEVREIVRHYDDDPEFREQVNRYIHDFEAILRNILATRDASPLGVTLLSSDMGKLYVALAQAIERLRA